MSYEIMPSVQTALEVFPEKKKDTFDRVMEVAHLLMDGTVGTVPFRRHQELSGFPLPVG